MRRSYSSNSNNSGKKTSNEYFWIKNEGTAKGSLILKIEGSCTAVKLQYSFDKSKWTDITFTSSGAQITLGINEKVYFKGYANTFCSSGSAKNWNSFTTNASSNAFHIGGNIMSLFYDSDFKDKTAFDEKYSAHCVGMFYNSVGFVDASELVLPATTLTKWSYGHMFQQSAQLMYPPNIHLDDIQAGSACKYMFYGCTSLIETPELWATTHNGKSYCYDYMFTNCSALSTIRIHLLTWGGSNRSVFSGVSLTGTIYMPKDATWKPSSYGVPSAWTVQNTL